MVECLLFAAVLLIAVKVQRQTCHRLRQDTDAGIHRCHLHGRTLVNILAGGGAAEEKTVPAAGCPVLGLVAGFEQARKDAHRLNLTFFLFLDIQILDKNLPMVYS